MPRRDRDPALAVRLVALTTPRRPPRAFADAPPETPAGDGIDTVGWTPAPWDGPGPRRQLPSPTSPGDPAGSTLPASPADPAPPAADSPAPAPPPTPTRTSAALRSAAVGYVAAHGDPLDPAPRRRRRVRWVVSWRLAAGAAAVLALVGGGVALRAASMAPGPAVTLPVPAPQGTDRPSAAPTGEVVVDVVGAVAAPGVVRLAAGSRVVDAIAAAGSGTSDARLSALNLARVLVDGEQIVVPSASDPVAASTTGPAAGGDERVDLNAADASALDALPGIGPVLAGRIVAHREDHPFSSVDELADVAGIGPTLLDRLRDLVRV